MNDIEDMYANTDEVSSNVVNNQPKNVIDIKNKSTSTEITIDGKKIVILNPSIVQDMNNIIRRLERRIELLDTSIQSLNRRMAAKDQEINRLYRELENKIDYGGTEFR